MSPHARTRATGLAAALTLVMLVAATPVILIGIGATPTSSAFTWSALTVRDDGTLALAAVAILAWTAWLVFTTAVAVEILARVRGIRAPRLPGLAVPQMASARLVGTASLLFLALPVAATINSPRTEAAPTWPATPASTNHSAVNQHAQPDATPVPTAAVAAGATPIAAKPAVATETYTVKRGDSLWRIAQQRFGDGTRYVELAALNHDVLGDRPDFLLPGTELRVPAVARGTDAADTMYVVQPGDTLSQIAEDRLGDATAYPRLAQASTTTMQPDGDRLTDPNLIRPGWHITIPSPAADDAPPPPRYPDASKPRTPPAGKLPKPTPPPQPGPGAHEGAASQSARGEPTHGGETEAPGWLMPGLAGAGAALAGALLLKLRQHRRTQLRYRQPGQILAAPPEGLRDAEKSVQVVGSLTAPRIDAMDQALRAFAESPCLVTAILSTETLTLRLSKPAELAAPWRGADVSWSVVLDDLPELDGGAPAYPLLVSVGQQADGALVYVNLEELKSLAITGDPGATEALARHLAVELSLNPWSARVEIDTVGIGSELKDIDPMRLRHHDDGAPAHLERLAGGLDSEDPAQEPDQFRAILANATRLDSDAPLLRISKIITSYEGRAGATIVTLRSKPTAYDTEVHLANQRLTIPSLRFDLIPAGLTADEAIACARLVDATRDIAENVDVPTDPTDPTRELGGALSPSHTTPRPTSPTVEAGDTSLLPLDDQTYEQVAATTAEDLQRLAPSTVPGRVAQAENTDPDLDDDLARWEAPVVLAPQLHLLGPVTARTGGDAKQVAHRKPFYVELLSYLAIHPRGVTAADVADALGIRTERARTDLSVVRRWLGDDTQGQPHLPNARSTAGLDERGAPVYRVQGVLSDLDLFRRLRTRGQRRGAEGIDDLIAALRLVSGQPFSDLRPAGWSWLLDGDRVDHIATCAVVDVAHIITTHAVADGDLDLARWAAERSYHAAPYDETARLDLISVASATGHAATADQQLIDRVLTRSDDGLGPVDLPKRTAKIVQTNTSA